MRSNKKKKAVGCSGSSESVAKRTRTAGKKGAVSKSGEECIHILNDDCWRTILDYVELHDLVRSECVSKQWQQIVHRYLQGVRFCLRAKAPQSYLDASPTIPTTRQWHVPIVKCRDLNIYPKHHVRVVEKYGRAIVAADCVDGAVLTALGQHCPNLTDLRVIDPQYLRLKRGDFNKLRRVSFHNVIMFEDVHISKFLSSTLEELTIIHNLQMTGLCLKNATNIKRLNLSYCYALDIAHLLSAPLSELTRLDLQGNQIKILENACKLIEKTPKLENLDLGKYPVTDIGGLTDAICGLSRLRHLNLNENSSVDDSLMEAVGRCCRELRTVNIGVCKKVTSAGVTALCRGAGKTLTALNVSSNNHVNEDDMALCISLCPKLEFLDVRYSDQVTARFAAAAARARAPAERGSGGGRGRGRGGGGAGGRGGRLRLALTPEGPFWGPGYLARVKKQKKTYANLILEEDSRNLKWEDYL